MTDNFIVQSGVVAIEIPPPPVIDAVVIQGPQGLTGPIGPAAEYRIQVLDGDGATEVFELDTPTVSDLSVQVFRNGLAELAGVGFTTSSDGGNTVVNFSTAPLADDEVQVVYQI